MTTYKNNIFYKFKNFQKKILKININSLIIIVYYINKNIKKQFNEIFQNYMVSGIIYILNLSITFE